MRLLRRYSGQIIVSATVIILLWLVLRGVSWTEVVATFQQLRWPWILGVAIVTFLAHVIVSARWWYLLWGFGHKLPFWRTVRYRATVYGLSYVTPGPQVGGEVLQVYYPVKGHAVPTAASITAATVDKSLEFLGNFSFIMVGIVVMLVGQRVVSGADLYAMIASSTLMLIPAILLVFVARGRHPLSTVVKGARRVVPSPVRKWLRVTFPSLPNIDNMHQTVFHSEELMAWLWEHRKGSILMALLLTIVALILVAVDFWMIAEAIGLGLTKTQTIGTMVMVYFAYLLPVPGGLGAIEAAVVLSFTTFGFSTAQALSVALIMRVRDTVQAVIGLALGGFGSLRSAVNIGTSETLLGDGASMTVEEAEEYITGQPSPLHSDIPYTAGLMQPAASAHTSERPNKLAKPQPPGSPVGNGTRSETNTPAQRANDVAVSDAAHRSTEG